jgi:hypothetical protein
MGTTAAPTPLQQSVSVAAPPRGRGGLFAGVILATALVSGVGVFLATRGSSPGKGAASTAPTATADTPAAATASAAPTAAATQDAPKAPATQQAAADTASPAASASVAPSAVASAVAPKKLGGPMPTAKPKAKGNCDPNFYLDAEGQKHFKPECFK